MSNTTSPVTQLADVDVNSAFTSPIAFPVDAQGSINRTVPVEMRIKNPKMRSLAGDWIKDMGNMIASLKRFDLISALSINQIEIQPIDPEAMAQRSG